MATADWTDVRFDYEGSLALARRLWQLSDQVLDGANDRKIAAGEALTDWAGPLAIEFAGRSERETDDLFRISTDLRNAALAWSAGWAQAVNLQNRRLFARACSIVRERRSLKDKVWGAVAGHHDLPPEPYERWPPAPPNFTPTDGFARYAVLS